jgi:phosphoserine phosphatase RsbU/P
MMERNLFQRIQKGVLEKRQSVNDWLSQAAPERKEACCGSEGPECVTDHIEILDTTLQSIESGSLGECEVCHETVNPRLLEMDYTACVCLDHYNAEERRRLESELEFSSTVQRALMPQPSPMPDMVDLAAFTRPAEIISGDTFDFFKFQDGAQGVAIADAVGHGVSAGLLMASIQTALRLLVPENISPAAVLDRINQLFLHNHHFTTFATVFLASFDPYERRLVYSNGGQNPPLLYSVSDGTLTRLLPTGPAVGLVEAYRQRDEALRLAPGDLLLLYTDGVTESRNHRNEDFSLDRLATLVRQSAGLPSAEVVKNIRQALDAHLEGLPPEDDATLMAINFP